MALYWYVRRIFLLGRLRFTDIEGMLNGEIKMHVWITWDEQGKITSISTLYVNPEDGVIYDYSVLPDGQVKEGPIM